MAVVTVERVGGLAGFGMARSRIRSRGEVDPDQLGAADRRTLDRLFSGSARGGKSESTTPVRDGFVYVLSRPAPNGTETVRLPESAVPAFISACVVDELR